MLTLIYSGPDSAAFAVENRPLGYSVGGTLLVGGAIVWSMALGPSVTTSWLEREGRPKDLAALPVLRATLARARRS